jgi:hypothetical protein
MTTLIRRVGWALVVALATGGAAYAGGGEDDGSNDFATEGPSYFGFVWDTRGVTVPGARVVLKARGGKSVEVKTNLMGLYRTHVSKDAKPEDIELTCDKAGYTHSKFMRRTHPGTSTTNIELDCVVAKK